MCLRCHAHRVGSQLLFFVVARAHQTRETCAQKVRNPRAKQHNQDFTFGSQDACAQIRRDTPPTARCKIYLCILYVVRRVIPLCMRESYNGLWNSYMHLFYGTRLRDEGIILCYDDLCAHERKAHQ